MQSRKGHNSANFLQNCNHTKIWFVVCLFFVFCLFVFFFFLFFLLLFFVLFFSVFFFFFCFFFVFFLTWVIAVIWEKLYLKLNNNAIS